MADLEARVLAAEEELRTLRELREEDQAELMVYREYVKSLVSTCLECNLLVEALRVIGRSSPWASVREMYPGLGREERGAYEVLERAMKRPMGES